MRKRLISFLLAMIMLFSALPMHVFAVESIDDVPTTDVETCVHSYETIVTAPTCTEIGYTTYICSLCGDSYTADETAALDHNYEAVVTAPTCTEAGFTTYTCSVCGNSYIADEIAALDHNYEAVVTAPTCTEAGFTTYTCSVCGDSYVADETSMIEHTEEIIPAVAPTCTETGLTEGKYCSVCNEVLVAQEEVAKLDHNYVEGICSECGAVTLYLEAPTANISNVTSTGKLQLSWQAVEGAVSYDIYCAETEDGEFAYLNNITSTKVTHSSVAAGASRYYYIVAVAEDGTKSAASNIIGGVCKIAQPKLTASNVASTGKIKVSWDAVEGAVKYQLYKSTDGENFTLASTTTKTTITHSSSEVGVQYYYKVRAIAENSAANSADSAVKSRMCDLPQPKLTASNVASTGKIKISWDAVEEATKYTLYIYDEDGELLKSTTTKNTSITHSSAIAGETYTYKLRAKCGVDSATSAYSSAKDRTCDLAQPAVTVTLSSKCMPQLRWDAVDGAVKYRIYRSTSKNGEYSLLTTTSKTSITNTSAEIGSTYYYKVRAIAEKSSANSAYSDVVSTKAAPAAPSMKTTAKSTSSTITISWNESNMASGYYIYRRASADDSWSRIASVTSGSTTSYTDDDVKGRYYYSIAAYITVDGTKHAGSKSDAIRVRTLGKTAASVEAVDDEFQNIISWSSVSGATGYQVYYKTSENDSWKRAATVGDITSYTHDVDHGIYYTYKVRAIYKNNGVTTYGPYGAASESWIHYYTPNIETFMNDTTKRSTSATVIYIQNNGAATARFYAKDGKWIDADYESYDRDIVLFDYEAFNQDEELVLVNYVDIKPGESTYLLIGASSDTWYDANTTIRLDMRYDGVDYVTYTSCSAGFRYYEY